MLTKTAFLIPVLLALIASAGLSQQRTETNDSFQPSVRSFPSERVGVNVINQLSLTLEDAIRLALQNNPEVDSSKINVRIAELNLRIAQSVYDPIIAVENYYESRTVPSASAIGGAGALGKFTQSDLNASISVSGFSPVGGGSYQLDFSTSRTNTTNQNALLNPQFPSSFSFSYTQPLIRGLRFDARKRNIEIAKKNLSLSDTQFRQKVIEIISQVEQAYWELAFALKNLQTQTEAVKQAQSQLESNERLVEKGVLAPIEIVAARSQLTTFEQNVYLAQEAVTRAENNLKTLILKDRNSSLWYSSLIPISPVEIFVPQIPVEEAINQALKNRLELRQIQTDKEVKEIDERFYRDQLKPQVDLVATYTATGIAGAANEVTRTTTTINPELLNRVNQLSLLQNLPPLNISPTTTTISRPPDALVGNYFSSLTDIFTNRYPTYRVGVRISLPFRNTVAEAELGKTLAEKQKLENQKLQTEQMIEAEVRNALQSLRSAEARLKAATAARVAAEELYESEKRQFNAGLTTVYMVLQRQNDLLQAKNRELQAQTDLSKAISNFYRVIGATLEHRNVTF
ncbi:MAG: TolC family protein [Pyrinomonadaceae bacterium]|nr:TolC family protein [Pyrinomonadaceae bacterium]MCX7640725.1 TolC family protein [Pyrinomonadaceae bacterium]MDW8305307.1 TolC family protein [Acidobacteriota bacterium]